MGTAMSMHEGPPLVPSAKKRLLDRAPKRSSSSRGKIRGDQQLRTPPASSSDSSKSLGGAKVHEASAASRGAATRTSSSISSKGRRRRDGDEDEDKVESADPTARTNSMGPSSCHCAKDSATASEPSASRPLRRFRIRNGGRWYPELNSELVVQIIKFLPNVQERHAAAACPVNRAHRAAVRENKEVWLPLCVSAPWFLREAELWCRLSPAGARDEVVTDTEDGDDDDAVALPIVSARKLQATCGASTTQGRAPSARRRNKYAGPHSSEAQAAALRQAHLELVEATRRVRTPHASVEFIAETMARFSRIVGVTHVCLEALVDRLHVEAFRKRALEATDTTILVIRALRTFADQLNIQLLALNCIVFLARPLGGTEGMVFHRGFENEGRRLRTTLAEHAGVEAVLGAMVRHKDDADIQAMACWSLVNLALNREQKVELRMLGGLDLVVQAMALHPMSLDVQFRALFALINLVIPEYNVAGAGNDEAQNHTVIRCVLAALKNFPDSERLVRCGSLVLHNISLHQDNIPYLLSAGVAEPLMRAVRTHTDNDVQRSAMATLRRLGVATARLASQNNAN